LNALMSGRYDGVMPIPELLRYGDFGLGTLDHLDGELIVLDGRSYQARGDDVVVEVGPERSTPFAIVTLFEPDGSLPRPPGRQPLRPGRPARRRPETEEQLPGRARRWPVCRDYPAERPPPGAALPPAGRSGQEPVGPDP